MKITPTRVAILVLALSLAGGCASQQQIDEIRDIAEAAQSTANNAASQASSALSTANQALTAARNAQAAAEAAQACCDANTSRIDRAFEQAMQK